MVDIKNTYSKLKKKYLALPDFEGISKDFDLHCIEHEEHFSREVVRCIKEKLDHISSIFITLVNPPENIVYTWESSSLKNNSNDVYKTLKRIMFYFREATRVDIISDEEDDVKFISAFYKEWDKELRDEIISHLALMRDSWTKESEKNEELRYLG